VHSVVSSTKRSTSLLGLSEKLLQISEQVFAKITEGGSKGRRNNRLDFVMICVRIYKITKKRKQRPPVAATPTG